MTTPRILLVDDVAMFLEIERSFFRNLPVRIMTAADGAMALAVARSHRPALIFLDLNMPVMNGADCCRQLKRDPELQRIPVVMITAQGKEDDRLKCLQAGCDWFLTKPLDRERFVATARRYLPTMNRRSPRIPCTGAARFKAYGITLSAEVWDISGGGVFLAGGQGLEVGDEMDLSFSLSLKEGNLPVQAKGRVCWVNGGGHRAKATFPDGFGVEFVSFADGSDSVVARYVGVPTTGDPYTYSQR